MANFENITIEKGMYQTKGKSLTDVLESLDPSKNYEGTSLEGLDAFGRQLKRFDIRVSGKGSDCVEKFFQSSSSAALFPEYISRAVKQGMEQADIIPDIVATVTNIDGMDYRSIASVPTDAPRLGFFKIYTFLLNKRTQPKIISATERKDKPKKKTFGVNLYAV